MSRSPFDPPFEALPSILPVFPLAGALLLPGGQLSLNIFEPRYLAMVNDALAKHRLIGMIQPMDSTVDPPGLFRTGCAGRLTAFSETPEGRFVIRLSGLLRFDVAEELELCKGYRRIRPDWTPYRGDLVELEEEAEAVDRSAFLAPLKAYFDKINLTVDWADVERSPLHRLVTSLAMVCPFTDGEKQALLEAAGLQERTDLLLTMIRMALAAGDGGMPTGSGPTGPTRAH